MCSYWIPQVACFKKGKLTKFHDVQVIYAKPKIKLMAYNHYLPRSVILLIKMNVEACSRYTKFCNEKRAAWLGS